MPNPFSRRADLTPFKAEILVLPSFSLMSLAATLEPMRAANRAARQTLYAWELISPDGAPPVSSSGVPLAVSGAFIGRFAKAGKERLPDALITVSAFDVERHARPVLGELRRAGRAGIALGGVEAGSWALAFAGLLDGYRATTHWEDLDAFATRFPAIDTVPDRFVIDRARFTTGGATPALDMMLELIRMQHGMALALDVASLFIYEQARLATEPQRAEPQRIITTGRLALIEPRIADAVRLMEEHISTPIPVAAIARKVALSQRGLEMKFREMIGATPQAFYMDLRLNAGRRMLVAGSTPMSEIADASGFASASAFARAFRKRFGQSPSEARQQLRTT